jgi:hypothetical protein
MRPYLRFFDFLFLGFGLCSVATATAGAACRTPAAFIARTANVMCSP